MESIRIVEPLAVVLCQNSALLKNHVCNLMHRKALVSSYQHLMADAPANLRPRPRSLLVSISRRTASPLTNDDIGGVRVLSSFVFLDTTAFSH